MLAIRALSFNVYFGFDGYLALEDPMQAFSQLMQNDAKGRLQALGNWLTKHQPHVAGLQEMMKLSVIGADGPIIFADFLSTLLASIAEAGGPEYQAFSQQDVENKGFFQLGEESQEYHFETNNVLLVHPSLSAREAGHRRYERWVLTEKGGVRSGIQHLHLKYKHRSIDVLHTHMEGYDQSVREAQARELATYLDRHTTKPVLVLGDFNAHPQSFEHRHLLSFGLVDTFEKAGSGPGWTYGQDATLDNDQDQSSMRIDYIFAKAASGSSCIVRNSQTVLAERVPRSDGPGHIWPSDHFGVYSHIEI